MKSVVAFLGKCLGLLRPQTQQVQTQRMCPYCGLITPRFQQSCLECGRLFAVVPLEPKDAR